ncbi:hypothetical protein V2J09_013431 [Rumex salicifolius]
MEGSKGVSSRKGLELKLSEFRRRWRSKGVSRRVVQDSLAVADADVEQRSYSWAHLPPELLREVLLRVEISQGCWPMRSNVVACAGVCKNWRNSIKEIVKTPQFSGKLTFPISVKQPGPRESMIKCFIKRNRATQTYYLYLSLTNALAEDGKFVLASRRFRHATCNDYVVSIHPNDMSKGGSSYIGKLRSNFLGTKFTIYDAQRPHPGAKMTKSNSMRLAGLKQVTPRIPFGNYSVAQISYELNVLGSRGPRRMLCTMGSIPASAIEPGGVAPTQTDSPLSSLDNFSSLHLSRSESNCTDDNISRSLTGQRDEALVLRNKAPRWHDQLQCWCLNFLGRVTVASVKNFQLVASPENCPAGPEHEVIILQFGKVGKDVFTMDYRYPISAFQAFSICLSSFDTKIACE